MRTLLQHRELLRVETVIVISVTTKYINYSNVNYSLHLRLKVGKPHLLGSGPSNIRHHQIALMHLNHKAAIQIEIKPMQGSLGYI